MWEPPQLGAQVRAISNHVHRAATRMGGDRLDQLAGDDGLGRTAPAPQPGQHRQRNRPAQKRQRDDDRGDHESVATGQFCVAFGHFRGAVVGPVRGINPTAATSEQSVVNGNQQRRAEWHEMAHHEPQHREPDHVGVPAGIGKEPVRPAVVPHPGQPGTGQHPTHRPARGRGDQPSQQRDERSERRGGEARPERLQHAAQRPR
jgi:hypothetical protein